jgi:hypothetical protein
MSDFLEYYRYEQSMPLWYRNQNVWIENEKEYLEFCDRCTVYELGNAAIFIEPKSRFTAECYFSVKGKVDVGEIVREIEKVKIEVFSRYNLIFGWIAKKNYGIRKVCEKVGFSYFGFRQYYGTSHSRPIEWMYVALSKKLIADKRESVL